MRLGLSLGACLVMVIAPLSATLARDIFVDNRLGDDRRTGGAPESTGEVVGPCRSIAKALRVARPGDRIVLASTGEPYREAISIQGPRHSGSDRFPLVILGNGATLDGSIPLAEAEWEYVGRHTFRTRPPHMSYQQLFLAGEPAVRQQPAEGKPIELAELAWCLVEGWIYFRVEEGKLPAAYELACCGGQVGITLYEVHDVIVQDLTIRGFWLDGVNCHDNVRRTDLVRITANANGRSGISIGGASRVRVDTCSAAGNGAAQIRTEGYCIAELLDNKLDAASAPAVVRDGGRIVTDTGR
jgi:hypothetical protein